MADWHGDHPVVDPEAADPHLATIQRFPFKSLDPERPDTATLVTHGALAGDRVWAIVARPPGEPFDPDRADVRGSRGYVNGKRTDAVHRIRSTFVPPSEGGPAVTLHENGDPPEAAQRFALATADDDVASVHAPLDEWLSEYFGRPVSVRRHRDGYHDDRERHGPTVISTATLREVAAWFDFDLASARRRFRANLEISGVPPFWEDRLFTDTGAVVAFRVGDATLEGVLPCQRCVVPGRDPDTGEETPNYRETFIRTREATLPPWTDCDRFDHLYRLMLNTRVPEESAGAAVAVGDTVEVLGTRAE